MKKNNKVKTEGNLIDDTTEYGEFMTSYFAWIDPEKQKARTQELEQIKEKERKQKKNE